MEKKQPSLTIVSVTGHQGYAEGSMYSIMRSYEELRPQIQDLRCILISPEKPQSLPEFILHIPCQSFSYLEYNLFILYSLGQFIETDFALIVQNDGWVMDGKNWDPRFFDYDYIGAPIALLAEPDPLEHKAKGFEYWREHYNNIPENMFEPQNGGFSLRSKKLLNAPRELDLRWQIGPPKLFTSLPLKMAWKNGDHNEDIYLSIGERRRLEEYGLRFAPSDIATYFAAENHVIANFRGVPVTRILGIHLAGVAVLKGINYLQLTREIQSVESLLSNELFAHLHHLGYYISANLQQDNVQK